MWMLIGSNPQLPAPEENVLLTVLKYERDKEDEDSYDEYVTTMGYMEFTPWNYAYDLRSWFIYEPKLEGCKVIAWQHLPEPYDQEDE